MCDSQNVGDDLDAAACGHRRDFTDKTALADPRRTHQSDHCAVALDRAVEQAVDGSHLPRRPTSAGRFADRPMLFPMRQQPARRHRFVGTLDLHQLRLAETAALSTNRAVEALSITPPGGAADSIRCAMPTCSPMAV